METPKIRAVRRMVTAIGPDLIPQEKHTQSTGNVDNAACSGDDLLSGETGDHYGLRKLFALVCSPCGLPFRWADQSHDPVRSFRAFLFS